MQKVLFITIGNRDLQLPPSAKIERSIGQFFEEGNKDVGENEVIKKRDFISCSEHAWESYDQLSGEVVFPMIQKSIDLVGEGLNEIVLVTTKQDPLDAQDCHYIALFVQKWLTERKYTVKYRPITFPPVDLGQLLDFFTTCYNEYEGWDIFFGNSGGTPDMRTASHMAGMFKGIEFITFQAREQTSHTRNFIKQERLVLSHIVNRMLDNYDYSGIQQLPLQDENIHFLANYAQTRLLLDRSTLNQQLKEEVAGKYPTLVLQEDMSTDDQMKEVVQSARIKFHQKAYADYLWRIFTIGDNLLIPHVELLLEGRVEYVKKDGHALWNQLLANKPELVTYLSNCKINEVPLKIDEPNAYAYDAILKYFVSINAYNQPITLDPLMKIINDLRPLRNAIAHNMKGIGLDEIESKVSAKQLRKADLDTEATGVAGLNTLLCRHFSLDEGDFGIYDEVNQLIRKQIDMA